MGKIKFRTQIALWGIVIILGIYFLMHVFMSYNVSGVVWEDAKLFSHLKNSFQKVVIVTHLPSLTFPLKEETGKKNIGEIILDKVWEEVPIYHYYKDYVNYDTQIESEETIADILASEAQNENVVDPSTGEVTVANGAVPIEDTLPEPVLEETPEKTQEQVTETASLPFSLDQLNDYNFLYNTFYTGDKTTSIGADQLNKSALLDRNMVMATDNTVPQILVYHTHSSEGYADSIPGDYNTTVVGVGNRLVELLRDTYGFNVIHETGVYDVPRDDAYAKTPPVLEKILNENPSIEVIIDVHRDGIANEQMKLVKEVNGKQMAQFMFVNGLSYTNFNGDISYLANPNKADNLAFSFQLQLKATEYYPGLARKIYLKQFRFNMHYRPKSLILEVGAQTNTLEEAVNTMDPVADILNKVLKGIE